MTEKFKGYINATNGVIGYGDGHITLGPEYGSRKEARWDETTTVFLILLRDVRIVASGTPREQRYEQVVYVHKTTTRRLAQRLHTTSVEVRRQVLTLVSANVLARKKKGNGEFVVNPFIASVCTDEILPYLQRTWLLDYNREPEEYEPAPRTPHEQPRIRVVRKAPPKWYTAKMLARAREKKTGVHKGRPEKLTPKQKAEVVRRHRNGEKIKDIAESYGVARQTISSVLRCDSGA